MSVVCSDGHDSDTPRRRRRMMIAAIAAVVLAAVVVLVALRVLPGRSAPGLVAATGAVAALPPGAELPTEYECAARVVPTAENRPGNAAANSTTGPSPNDENPRVTGNFVGTTDEIIQWAACKWGLDVDWARNQAALESGWHQPTALGDWSTDPLACLPGHPIGADGRPGECPESIGLLQVRWLYHQSAFEEHAAIVSTAYNADYAWSIWRRCFDGEYTWLNDVERGADYAAGDGLGCMGVWFSGRWYTPAARSYMETVPTAGHWIRPPATLARDEP